MRRFALVFLFGLVVAFVPWLQSSAAAKPSIQTKLSAIATFLSTDEAGCVVSEVAVAVADVRQGGGTGARVYDPPAPEDVPAIYVAVTMRNECTGEVLVSASGVAPFVANEIAFRGQFQVVEVNASVPLTNPETGTGFAATVNLRWEGTGVRTQATGGSVGTPPPGTTALIRSLSRRATVVGTVTDGEVLFTPSPGTSASLFSVTYVVG